MATQFFKNFPEMQYKLSDGKLITIKDFFRKSNIEGAAREAVVNYTYHELEEGDRPDVLATKLYGNGDLHWTFFLVNDLNNYYDWWKDQASFQSYMEKRYKGKYFVCNQSTDIVSSTSKFLLGESITGTNSRGIITEVDPTFCRLGVDVEVGFVSPIVSTGSSSSKAVTPVSIIDKQDGVAYYEKDGVKSTHFVSGSTAKSIFEDEYEINEEKRKIKIIKPSMIGAVVNQFEKVMKS
tara:strand:- start:3211 stop:3921 length:711 start_codon:yes stop_codon:yes gene_type:complete